VGSLKQEFEKKDSLIFILCLFCYFMMVYVLKNNVEAYEVW